MVPTLTSSAAASREGARTANVASTAASTPTLGHVSPEIPAAESGAGVATGDMDSALDNKAVNCAGGLELDCFRLQPRSQALCGLWSLVAACACPLHACIFFHCSTALLVSSAGCYVRVNCGHTHTTAEPKYKAYLSVSTNHSWPGLRPPTSLNLGG